MKINFRKTIILFFFFVTLPSFASKTSKSFDWTKVIDAIIQVESEGNAKARNKKGDCAGIMQITPVLVKDCNRILKDRNEKRRFTLKDRYNVKKSKEMFVLIQEYYNPTNSIEKAIRSWNGGCNYSKRSTNEYYKKVMAAMR